MLSLQLALYNFSLKVVSGLRCSLSLPSQLCNIFFNFCWHFSVVVFFCKSSACDSLLNCGFYSACYSFAFSNPSLVAFAATGLGILTLGVAGFCIAQYVPPQLPSLLQKAINYTPLPRPYPDLTDAKHIIRSFKHVTEGLAYGEMPDHFYSKVAHNAQKLNLWADKASSEELLTFLAKYEEVLEAGGTSAQVYDFINTYANLVSVQQVQTWAGWFLSFIV